VGRKAEKIFKTPLGWAGVAVSEKGICRIVLPKKEKKAVLKELQSAKSPFTPSLSREGKGGVKMRDKAVKLLRQYFSGKAVSFALPLDMRYYTAFQQAVWKTVGAIPFGVTRSYGWIAKRIGRPRAARAVGQAMGANPFPIIIP
jgi:O6-methylguanine-DNA--protein-cysteine methyltransferase